MTDQSDDRGPSLRRAASRSPEEDTGYVKALVRATSPPFALLLAVPFSERSWPLPVAGPGP